MECPSTEASLNYIDVLIYEITQVITSLLGTVISSDSPLMSAGLDSLGATELARELGDRLGITLP